MLLETRFFLLLVDKKEVVHMFTVQGRVPTLIYSDGRLTDQKIIK